MAYWLFSTITGIRGITGVTPQHTTGYYGLLALLHHHWYNRYKRVTPNMAYWLFSTITGITGIRG